MKDQLLYGWNDTELNSHLTKNSEWGAVAYLAYSSYGRNQNNITVNQLSNSTGGEINQINTNQSTTGNLYGIYDMSGSVWEYVAAYSSIGLNPSTYGDSCVSNVPTYCTIYGNNFDDTILYKGDALYETSDYEFENSAWLLGASYWPDENKPWLIRGGFWLDPEYINGLFSYSRTSGQASSQVSFRVVLVPTD